MYMISTTGRVKSVERKVNGRYGNISIMPSRLLTPCFSNNGYLHVTLSKSNIRLTKLIHKLSAMAFLGHIPCGSKLVINHINLIKTDNRIQNLEIVTTRENTNLKHIPHSSKYTGVSKNGKNWLCRIVHNGKSVHLGRFTNEYDAHLAYEKKLAEINQSK